MAGGSGAGKVGSAYLSVVPKLSNDFGSKVASGGSGHGSDYGGKFSGAAQKALSAGTVALGNILANAATTAASKVGDLFKTTFSNYANYEQLVGGVDTLFKESSAIVQENAANAFKTAGMAANEYMEQVTSFSASLLQGLGGDTAAAASYADTAMRDMSDNANKMGTDMSRITDAYQGFAKQNYTMLDNLKLGYGGTKTEMERLLKDASDIAGVEFNIDNYQDVIEAIHVMQTSMDISGYSVDELSQKLSDMSLTGEEVQKVADDMGISYEEAMKRMKDGTLTVTDAQALLGTTAKEAATTIEGSMGMMRASFDNLLTGILDENADVGALFESFIESVGIVADNLAPRFAVLFSRITEELPNAFAALPDMIRPILERTFGEAGSVAADGLQGVMDAVSGAVGFIQERWPMISEIVGAVMEGVVGFIEEAWPIVSDVVSTVCENVMQFVSDVWPTVSSVIGSVTSSILSLIQAAWPVVSAVISTVMDAIAAIMSVTWPAIGGLITGVMDTITGIINVAWPAIQGVISAVSSAIDGIINTVWPAIQGIISSVMGGIQGAISSAWSTIQGVVSGAIGVIKGVIDGISSVIGSVQSTFASIQSAITGPIETARDTISGIVGEIMGFFTGLGQRITDAIGSIHFPVPHISWDDLNIGNVLSLPIPTVEWYANGAILTGATIFGRLGNKFLGGGEAGPEAVLPISDLRPIVADAMQDAGGRMRPEQTFNLYTNDPVQAYAMIAARQRRAMCY